MKVIAGKPGKYTGDFYISTLAPVARHGEKRCGILAVTVLTVLFLELGVLVRMVLAN